MRKLGPRVSSPEKLPASAHDSRDEEIKALRLQLTQARAIQDVYVAEERSEAGNEEQYIPYILIDSYGILP